MIDLRKVSKNARIFLGCVLMITGIMFGIIFILDATLFSGIIFAITIIMGIYVFMVSSKIEREKIEEIKKQEEIKAREEKERKKFITLIQDLYIDDLPDMSKMNKKDIDNIMHNRIETRLKQYNDCKYIILSTKNIKIFFSRFKFYCEILNELSKYESLYKIDPSPSQELAILEFSKEPMINAFFRRYNEEFSSKILLLKTRNAQEKRIEKYLNELQPYMCEIPEKTMEEINRLIESVNKLI